MTKHNFTPLALDILKDRYLWKDSEGKVIETPDDMFHRVAKHVACAEKTPEDRAEWEGRFYEVMSSLDFLPNSPTLMNAGRPAPHGQLSACFVIGVPDSMEGICEALRKQMLIHKSGGGTGFNFSKLRAKGGRVNSTNGVASGPVSFMQLFDLSTEVVQQGGCFTGDTLIATAEGAVKISELKEGMLVYSYHPERGFILTPCTAPFLTKKSVEVMELETDKGLKVRATPDHPFMYRCGSTLTGNAYGKLKDLHAGTPLMPLTTYNKKGYRYISLHDNKDSRVPLHRWLMEQAGKPGECIHHINSNCQDNRLSNLTNEYTNSGHATYHNKERIANGTHVFLSLTEEQHKKAGAGYSQWYASLTEAERQALKDKNAEALRVENQKRFSQGTHNFIGDRHPSKNPEIRLKQRKGRLAKTLWALKAAGLNPTAETIEECEKKAGLYNTQRYKLSNYVKVFGSFESALSYADARNCKVKNVTPMEGLFDVWNVEIPETHNYVVCNADCTNGVVVSNTRRGANMAILNCDHPDIREFIHCKDEEGKITNFNLSVGLTDAFMMRATRCCFSPEAALLHEIAEQAWKTGDPGVVFLDALERDNPTPELGRIDCTNPCGEEPLLPNEACNLGSINLTHMLTSESEIDWGKYRYVIEVATRFLSNVIEVNQYPLPEIKEAVQKTRKIGLGIMGYAHMLYYMGIAYDSQRALDILDDVMAYLWYRSRGYAETELSDRPDHKAFTCIAPTGTLSLIAGVSSGIEPVFSLSHTRTVTDTNGNKREVAVYDPVYEELMSDEANYTEEDIKRIFKTAYTVSPAWHVRTLATAQVWSDAGVSKTVNMPSNATVEDVQNVYIQAWTLGCKGTTVYRDGSKTSQVLKCPECVV